MKTKTATLTKEQCMDLLKKAGLPDNIVRHSVLTAQVARYIAEKLRLAGEDIDVEVVESAALLHDLSKFKCLGKELHHADDAGDALRKMGQDEIADIVEKHRLGTIEEPGRLKTWEEKVVYYADKRITDEEIKSLKQRFDYLEKRYHLEKGYIKKVKGLIERLEKEIFDKIKESPDLKALKDRQKGK